MAAEKLVASVEQIESRIFLIRGHCEGVELKAPGTRRRPPCGEKIMLDADLAELYGVETKRLNEQVRRNSERFPEDFMFQLSEDEFESLRSQFATLKTGRGQHRKYLPYAFTEHGTIMAASVLNSPRAIEVSVHVVRAFVRLRELVSTHKELSQKLNQLERKVGAHDKAIAEIIIAIRQLMSPSSTEKKRPIGFAPWKEK